MLREDAADLSTLADSGFDDFAAAADAELGVDFDVADGGVFFAAADGCCWLAVGVTLVAAFSLPDAAGFGVVPSAFGFAGSAGLPVLGLSASGWAAAGLGVGTAAGWVAAAAGDGASGSKASMSSFVDVVLEGAGAAAADTGADCGGVD